MSVSLKKTEKELVSYELVLLVRQDVSTAHVNDVQTNFKDLIIKNGGEVVYSEYCGLISLAYPVQRNKKAHFSLFHFKAPPSASDELEHKARLSPDILRFLKIKVEQFEQTPSLLAQSHLQREQFGKAQMRSTPRPPKGLAPPTVSGGRQKVSERAAVATHSQVEEVEEKSS